MGVLALGISHYILNLSFLVFFVCFIFCFRQSLVVKAD